jgi:hypothetical protein
MAFLGWLGRLGVVVTAGVFLSIAAPLNANAQDPMMRGDEGPRGHGMGDVGRGIGVGIGIGIGTGIMREILTNPQVQKNPGGQTPGGAANNNDRRPKKAARPGAGQETPATRQDNQDKKKTPVEIVKTPPPARPPVVVEQDPRPPRTSLVPPFMKLPGIEACKDCTELLDRILRMEKAIAEDERILFDLQRAKVGFEAELKGYQSELRAKLAKYQRDYVTSMAEITGRQIKHKDEQFDKLTTLIADERTSLSRMIADFQKCVQDHCPQQLADEPPPPPLPPKPDKTLDVFYPGDEVPSGTTDIDCDGHKGKVSTHIDVWITKSDDEILKNMISIGYEGSKCDDCIWVQFVWREIFVTQADGTRDRRKMHVDTTGGGYDTSDPDHPIYNNDSASRISPGYEYAGTAKIDHNSDTMFDKPNYEKLLKRIADEEPGDQKIETIGHFDTFLICHGQVCARVHWDVAQDFHQGDDMASENTYSGITISTSDRPNRAQRQAMVDKYGFSAIK